MKIKTLFFILILFFLPKIKTAQIQTFCPNLSANEIDYFITKPIKNKIEQIGDIYRAKYESYNGKSVIYIDFFGWNLQNKFDRLKRKVESADLPKGAKIEFDDEFSDTYPILIVLTGENYEELYDNARKLRDKILKIKYRSKAEIFGAQEETLYMYFKNSEFANLKITLENIERQIKEKNVIKGGGKITDKNNDFEINSNNFIKTPDDLSKTVLNINGKPIFCKDIFEIKKDVKRPLEKLIQYNGKNALIIGVSPKNSFLLPVLKYKILKTGAGIINTRKMQEIRIQLESGASFKKTKTTLNKFIDFLDTKNTLAFIGTAPPGYKITDETNFGIILTPYKKTAGDIKNFAEKNFPNVVVKIGKPNTGGLVKQNGASINYQIEINENAAIMAGFEPDYIIKYVNAFYNGKILTHYYRNDVRIPIVLKGDITEAKMPAEIILYSKKLDKLIPLSQVAKITPKYDKNRIIY